MKHLKFYIIILLISLTFSVNAQIISTVAGIGTDGYSGDGGLATAAQISPEGGIFVDANKNIFYGDNNSVLRKITGTTGFISTIAGTGVSGFSGDGGLATLAQIYAPVGIYEDNGGNVFFADAFNVRIRKITPAGIISTIAGTGMHGRTGDGGPATLATIDVIWSITQDAAGNLLIADAGASTIRKIDPSGIITLIAGAGSQGWSGDGGLATAAQIGQPYSVSLDAAGNYYIGGNTPNSVRKVNLSNIISTVGGNGSISTVSSGDGGPATSATFANIAFAISDAAGNIYIADGNRIRKIFASTGIITTIAGGNNAGFSGDGGLASSSTLNNPVGLSIANGDLYIIDKGNFRIRKISNVTTLPLKLLSFTGNQKGNNINLNWHTTNEVNFKYFNIQRSVDGIKYNTIGKVEALGNNSTTNNSYDFIDHEAENGVSNQFYYRLQINDADGGYSFSNIISINLNGSTQFSVSPNPAKEFIYIKGQNLKQLQIVDLNGKSYIRKTITSQNEKISISGLSKGIYLIKAANTNGQVQITKLVIE